MRNVALAEVASINPRGDSPPLDATVSFVGMAQLDAEAALATPLESRTYLEVSKGYTVFRDGDILAAKITPCWENGKVGQAQLDSPIGVGSTEFHVIRPSEQVHDRYLLHFLRMPEVRETGELRMTGSAGQRRVPATFLRNLSLPLPPFDEQRRIAAILDQADALRAKRRQTFDHLDALTQSIFHTLFVDTEWPSKPLSEVVRDGTIVTYGIVQAGPDLPDGVPYIRTGDISGGEIRLDGLKRTDPAIADRFQRSTVRTGEIVMSIRATVGTTAVVPPELDGANLTQGTARISPGSQVNGDYLLGFLRSVKAQHWIQAQVKGATFREITLGRLRQLDVPLPPPKVQNLYSQRVAHIRSQVGRSLEAAGSADELLASLQSRAFRGEL